MALSQVQCLDDNHVNWRVNEGKPEFFYSEDQRLALEALITGGLEAFHGYLKEHELRPFLSESELERLCQRVEAYRPGSETRGEAAGEANEERALSLQYWPDRSDISVPELDLGWPDCAAYRGVTRVTVYTQPPVDGQAHIKEVVRKTIAQAQKVIAVVMDVFTDVDIFRDLLEAGLRRRVAVYIIIEMSAVNQFLHMCERASMHAGHLQNLRVRCTGGSEFYTRSAQRICGSLAQRFMFVDGDRAISGSYSFTWTASRLDRNLITVMTGQAVETFDWQFRELYLTSRGVNLSKLSLAELPEPEPAPPVPAPAPPPSAAVARKLINPKYALVSADTASRTSSDKASASQNALRPVVKRQKEAAAQTPAHTHPGLLGLPKAELIAYLPLWPEPDPPSDVIGFINIRDVSRPAPVHLMRSQLAETSQAIRFSTPLPKTHNSDTHTDTHTHISTDKAADAHTDTHTHTDKHTHISTDKAVDTHTNTHTHISTDKAADTHTNTHTHISTDKAADTHTDSDKRVDTHTKTDTQPDTHTIANTQPDTHTGSPANVPSNTSHTHTHTPHSQPVDSHTSHTDTHTAPANTHTHTDTHTAPANTHTHTHSPQPSASAPPTPKPRTRKLLIGQNAEVCVVQDTPTATHTNTPQAGTHTQRRLAESPPTHTHTHTHTSSSEEYMDPLEEPEATEEKTHTHTHTHTHTTPSHTPPAPASNHSDDADSTAVIRGEGSDDSAPSEEFYDCDTPDTSGCHDDPSTSSGYHDNTPRQSHNPGLNLMARISQSMLDLREPPRQQPFKASSKSPAREAHGRVGGAKVVIAKPGNFPGPSHRHSTGGTRSPRRVIGGARYWQDRLSSGHYASPDGDTHTHSPRHGRSPHRPSTPLGHIQTSRSPAQRRHPHTLSHTHSPSPIRTHTLSRTHMSPCSQERSHTLLPSSATRQTHTQAHTSGQAHTHTPLGIPLSKLHSTKGVVAKGNASRKKKESS